MLCAAICREFPFKLLDLCSAGGSTGLHYFQHSGVFFLAICGTMGELQLEFGFRQRHGNTSRSLARRSGSELQTPPAICPLTNNGQDRVGLVRRVAPTAVARDPSDIPYGPRASGPAHIA